MDEETLDTLIRKIITSIKPYGNDTYGIQKYFNAYYKLTNSWEEFLEQASSPFNVINKIR